MTISKTISIAKQHAANGNREAAARILSGAIRAAASDRAANAYRAALSELVEA